MQHHTSIFQGNRTISITYLSDHMENDFVIDFSHSCQQPVKPMPGIKVTGYKQPFLTACPAIIRNRKAIQYPIRIHMIGNSPPSRPLQLIPDNLFSNTDNPTGTPYAKRSHKLLQGSSDPCRQPSCLPQFRDLKRMMQKVDRLPA